MKLQIIDESTGNGLNPYSEECRNSDFHWPNVKCRNDGTGNGNNSHSRKCQNPDFHWPNVNCQNDGTGNGFKITQR